MPLLLTDPRTILNDFLFRLLSFCSPPFPSILSGSNGGWRSRRVVEGGGRGGIGRGGGRIGESASASVISFIRFYRIIRPS